MTKLQICDRLPLSLVDSITTIDIDDDIFYTHSSDSNEPRRINIDSITSLLRRIHGSSQLQLAGQLYSAKKGSGLIFDKDIDDFYFSRDTSLFHPVL